MESRYRIMIMPEAAADIQSIHDFIAADSPQNDGLLIARILNAIETLKTLPHRTVIERRSPRLPYPVRSLVVRPYISYFRVHDADAVVRIMAVRHGARRSPRRSRP